MVKRLLVPLLLGLMCLPAFAASLAPVVQIRTPKDLQVQLESIEDAAIKAGAPKKSVYGSTAKLANFIEDGILSTGHTLTMHPPAILKQLVALAKSGQTKVAIGNKLIQLQKSSKL